MLSADIMKKALENNIPLSASIELTYRCNIKCRMCYQADTFSDELSTEEIQGIISGLADAGCLYLSFTGGEPLLRKDFWEIAAYAKEKSFAIVLLTNATLIGAREAEKIKKLNFLQVHISILGKDAETHDAITRAQGSFEKALNGARELVNLGVNVVFKTTLMKDNIAQYKDIDKLAKSMGAVPYFSPIIFPKNNTEQSPLMYRITDEDLKQLFRDLVEGEEEKANNQESNSLPSSLGLCAMGKTECNINPKGEVYPCVAVPIVVGDLKKNSFSNIWESSSVLDKIRTRRSEDISECRDCDCASMCALCPGLSFLENENLFAKANECCRITKILKEVTSYEKERV